MQIELTDRAAARVQTVLGKTDVAAGLRLGVRPAGCSGLTYVIEVANEVAEGDVVVETKGVRLIVDADSADYLNGMELDYRREGLNELFRFNNPNAKETCGCGESFTV